MLRARDSDGLLGLKTAPDELLGQARQRTRGYPRALESLAAILAADRGTTLPELLDQTAGLPGNVVQALVGEAFSLPDPLAQQVMQALAVYPVPVPPVAADYLLQPYQPAIDAAPVLGPAGEHAVRPPRGRPYYLHQVDRDYALARSRLREDGGPGRRPFGPLPGRRCGSAAPATSSRPAPRGKTGRPSMIWVRSWPSSSCATKARDYDTATQVLLGIDSELPAPVGPLPADRRAVRAAARPPRRPVRPAAPARAASAPATTCSASSPGPSSLSEQALAIARETGDRAGEATAWATSATATPPSARSPGPSTLYEQALAIARRDLGQIPRAIEL